MKKFLVFILILLCVLQPLFSQINAANNDTSSKKNSAPKDRNMFGLGISRGLTISSEGLTEGYVMFAVPNSASVYLINRKGQVVHEWKGNFSVSSPYLANDGSLVQNVNEPNFPVFAGGGETGRVQKITWDNTIIWDFKYANEKYHAHHDFAVMPNGNILAIAWEAKSVAEAIAAGRKPELTPRAGVWPDKIVEIEPQGSSGGKIVWEWHVWDHLIQDYDSKKSNYGKPAEHPGLLDFNMGEPLPPLITRDSLEILRSRGRVFRNQTPDNMGSDIYHFNAIKYNPELDQIVFSSPHLSEIFIIDHSTTIKQAAGHGGGRWGRGGDFLYRWGNPENYHRGDSTRRTLFGQHDIRWIEKGKPGEGHLTVFNNDIKKHGRLNYSAIFEIAPPTEEKGHYLLQKDNTYGPEKPLWTFIASDSISFWSNFISGAHRLSNGNTFIDEGAKGRFFEVTKDGKIVWEYLNPYHGDLRKTNSDPRTSINMTYSCFRSTFIPADHPALANRRLEPLNPQPEVFVMGSQRTADRK